jgi:DNA-binding PadR family transcriptional regulator
MPRSSSSQQRSSLGLVVLWLLYREPLHVYGMQKLIEHQAKDRVVNVRSRASLYQTIERLMRLGLVEVAETVHRAGYPDRVVYAITDAGRDAARTWLREMLESTGGEYPEFIAAVSILFGLPPDEAAGALETRMERFAAELANTEAALSESARVPRLFLLEEEYRRAVLEAEVSWLRGVIGDIRAGRLTWSEQWLLEIAAEIGLPREQKEGIEDDSDD